MRLDETPMARIIDDDSIPEIQETTKVGDLEFVGIFIPILKYDRYGNIINGD